MNSKVEISIVLPPYNAEAYLRAGLEGIRIQNFKNWELVAVNDGSTDNTATLFREITANWSQPVRLIERENGGGFAARNTGLDNVSADLIAFFDVNDLWYAHHLENLKRVLDAHADIDWVYAANKIVDLTQNRTIVAESSFYHQGARKEFFQLKTEKRGNVSVISDARGAEFQLRYGIDLGQQFSLCRKKVFADYRFRSDYRNEGADQVSVIRAFKLGFNLAYVGEIHGEYAIHSGNASAGCKGAPLEKYIRLRKALIRGFMEAASELEFTPAEVKALHYRLARDYFWQLGYNLSWQHENYDEAIKYFRLGLCFIP